MSQKLLCVGCGEMGTAILSQVPNGHFEITVCKPTPPSSELKALIHRHITDHANAQDSYDVVFLGIKPQQFDEVSTWLPEIVSDNCLIVSIMAGVPLHKLKARLNSENPIVRAMPNLAIATGDSLTGLFTTDTLSQNDKNNVAALFGKDARQLWLKDENAIDAYTALHGSGLAYYFLTIESLAAAGHHLGFTEDEAQKIAKQTCKDAAQLLLANPKLNAMAMRQKVTSKGGTTEAALDVLLGQLPPLYNEAVKTAYKRAQELKAS
ncbi:MAG: pyrroline-5-carboxylate reductase [Micavibrio sp.]|nr:pyrroline-5-carboxylate reductase [Micavibrio sp.]|tara:strand:+ start:507676 stop:508470 length:795 start_codon:yes stop_codon:yes gene_type:complete